MMRTDSDTEAYNASGVMLIILLRLSGVYTCGL
jgi:hypothetical protein